MNALGIAMVKNEADVIEAFVRHNLQYMDLLVVIDNRSTDGTREILLALRREGLPLLVIDDPVFGHFQSEKVTGAYRKVAPIYQPELVYFLDADEFLKASNRDALEATVGLLPPGSLALLPWTTYLPSVRTPAAAVLADPLGAMTRRRIREEPGYCKAVLRRSASQDADIVIEQGNHSAHLAGGGALPTFAAQGVAIAHLPVRSVDQLAAKAINGWFAHSVRNRHRYVAGEAFQWQAQYERIVRGQGLSEDNLLEVALGYAQRDRPGRNLDDDTCIDPMTAHYGSLRYLSLGRHSAIAKVAASMETLLAGSGAEPAGTPASAALDLAPLLDLIDVFQVQRLLAGTGMGRRLAAELQVLRPELSQVEDASADLLLAPELSLADSLSLARNTRPGTSQRVVSWPDRSRTAATLGQELQAWAEQGWSADLMATLGLRALASLDVLRHGAWVMTPSVPGRHARDVAVRAALTSAADMAPSSTQPAQRTSDPLESLALPCGA